MPPSSLYCCQASVSSVSAAARKRRIAASPGVRPPLAEAGVASANSRPAAIVAAPAAAPLSRKERRLLRCSDCSVVSMIFSLSNRPCQRAGGGAGAGLGVRLGARAPRAEPAARRKVRRRASLTVLRRRRTRGFAAGQRPSFEDAVGSHGPLSPFVLRRQDEVEGVARQCPTTKPGTGWLCSTLPLRAGFWCCLLLGPLNRLARHVDDRFLRSLVGRVGQRCVRRVDVAGSRGEPCSPLLSFRASAAGRGSRHPGTPSCGN